MTDWATGLGCRGSWRLLSEVTQGQKSTVSSVVISSVHLLRADPQEVPWPLHSPVLSSECPSPSAHLRKPRSGYQEEDGAGPDRWSEPRMKPAWLVVFWALVQSALAY